MDNETKRKLIAEIESRIKDQSDPMDNEEDSI